MILIDTGPLVALIHADDDHHERCKEALQSLPGSFATVWPVFTEAVYLLNFSWKARTPFGKCWSENSSRSLL